MGEEDVEFAVVQHLEFVREDLLICGGYNKGGGGRERGRG